METDNSIKSKIRKVKMVTKDLATLEIRKPVNMRVRNRVKEIQKLTQAVHEKFMHSENSYEWITHAPEEFLASLKVSISNGVGTIVWETYKKDDNGDKFFRVDEAKNEDGKVIVRSKTPVVDTRYVETIAKFKITEVDTQNV